MLVLSRRVDESILIMIPENCPAGTVVEFRVVDIVGNGSKCRIGVEAPASIIVHRKEVAERIVAPVDSEAYGRLAVLAQWRSEAKIAMRVHRSAFTPPPKVMSAVVHITPGDEPDRVKLPMLERITAAAFGQRRKMLRQSLKGVPGALESLETLGIDPQRRAETLSVADYLAIAQLSSA